MATAPGASATPCASPINASRARSVIHQKGAPSPTLSSSKASASAGMMTKVVSGIATTLASAPYSPALWKWNSAIGASAISTTNPVISNPTTLRPKRITTDSSRRARKARIGRLSCSAMIAVTAAKLSWKLGPASDSGRQINTISAPAATSLRVRASRPMRKATSTSSAAMNERSVGTSAPASNVYPPPASAPAAAASGRT